MGKDIPLNLMVFTMLSNEIAPFIPQVRRASRPRTRTAVARAVLPQGAGYLRWDIPAAPICSRY